MSYQRAEQYQSQYLSSYGFEGVMVHYRRQLLLERLVFYQPRIVVEIGCGSELLYEAWLKQGGIVDCWVIIEPASLFAAGARDASLPNLHVVEGFFENVSAKVRDITKQAPDLVICSALLHEVPSAKVLLDAIRNTMGTTTRLHINVPSATSMHRQLAVSMGLIEDVKNMSLRNLKLQQHRVYDMNSLLEELTSVGFDITEQGGYFIKPFTHAQMEAISPSLDQTILDGLYKLGKDRPEWSSEIYVEAKLK
jgi:phospholipid N-methyltransferase